MIERESGVLAALGLSWGGGNCEANGYRGQDQAHEMAAGDSTHAHFLRAFRKKERRRGGRANFVDKSITRSLEPMLRTSTGRIKAQLMT